MLLWRFNMDGVGELKGGAKSKGNRVYGVGGKRALVVDDTTKINWKKPNRSVAFVWEGMWEEKTEDWYEVMRRSASVT